MKLQYQNGGELYGNWDSDRTEQAVSNLIANAVQYGETGRPITITTGTLEDRTTIEVHNEGHRISEDDLTTIFSPMTRYSSEGEKVDNNKTEL